MMNMLSVIVPIYNSKQYLSKCIDSIIGQTYRELEIILVDDGSTDGSGEICDEYAKKDNRIKVFHRENRGLVASRKFGVHMASADYIAFVDSDDWIEPDMYENMMRRIIEADADIATSSIYIESRLGVGKEDELIAEGTYNRKDILRRILPCMMYHKEQQRRAIISSVWSKIFKKDLLLEIIKDVPLEMTYGEDAAIVYPYICKAGKIVVISDHWYHYVIRENSMARTYNIESFQKIKIFNDYMKAFYQDYGIWNEMREQVGKYVWLLLYPIIYQVYEVKILRPYVFPFQLIPTGSKVIIYGAGAVGKDYIKNLKCTNYADIVGWVDSNYFNFNDSYKETIVENPDIIRSRKYDTILIAVLNESIAKEIRKKLLNMGIGKEKIIWTRPMNI